MSETNATLFAGLVEQHCSYTKYTANAELLNNRNTVGLLLELMVSGKASS